MLQQEKERRREKRACTYKECESQVANPRLMRWHCKELLVDVEAPESNRTIMYKLRSGQSGEGKVSFYRIPGRSPSHLPPFPLQLVHTFLTVVFPLTINN